jgi:predicted N-acetyltransferase YhbS
MPQLEIQPFADEHLHAAVELLAERHRAHREAEPLLPAEVDFRTEISGLLAKETSGTVALRGRELVGYLLGTQRQDDDVWVELAGHAVREPALVGDLYAIAAGSWFEQGRTKHYAIVPANDSQLVDAWFRLSFGAQHAFGIREVPPEAETAPEGFNVRRAVPDDVEAMVRLEMLLPEYQNRSPVFGLTREPPDEEALLAEYREALSAPDEAILLAEHNGKPVGLLTMAPVERSGMHNSLARPEHACILGFAATVPEVRGSGAGLALTNAGLNWAREQGYEAVVVDWRETNLLSSRFWPARGFRRTFQRLYRSIP